MIKKAIRVLPIAMVVLCLVPLTVRAITVFDVGPSMGYVSKSLTDTVVNIVNWVLGLLALIAVIMIIYGGFRWMMAGGNEENVDKAKKLISAAVIGLIIVLLAWAIVIFVVNVTQTAGG